MSGSRIHVALVEDRERFIERQCGAFVTIAHLGCTDSPYTDYRLATGGLLHERLLRNGPVVGFDIDEPALARLGLRFPSAEFVCADVSDRVPPEYRRRFDLVVATEVLEHVPNPATFLSGARELIRPGGRLLVSVPNACSPKIGLRSLTGIEQVHPDHHVYYGPRTLRHALQVAGYTVEFMATYLAAPGPLGRSVNVLLRLANKVWKGPIGEGLIAQARPTESPRCESPAGWRGDAHGV